MSKVKAASLRAINEIRRAIGLVLFATAFLVAAVPVVAALAAVAVVAAVAFAICVIAAVIGCAIVAPAVAIVPGGIKAVMDELAEGDK